MKNMSNVKEILLDAGRYNQVKDLLLKTIEKSKKIGNFPVKMYVDENYRMQYDVNPKLVANEAVELIKMIDEEERECIKFPNLYLYIENEANRMLHNFSISISHRKVPDDLDMEKIRCYLIIQNLIDQYNIFLEDGEDTYYIPQGWRAVKGEE